MMKKLLCSIILAVIFIGYVQAQQDINVQGNSVNIVDGDTTPDLADHTDFGQVTVGSSLTRTYTIQNTGDAPLGLISIGTGLGTNSQFSVDFSGVTTPVPPSGSTTFTVTFDATSVGVANGSIVLISDDPDAESTYTYSITAEGIAVNEPDINVQGNSVDIADGDTTPSLTDHTDFGQISVGSSLTRTYTIQNTGGQALNLSSISFGLGSNSQFSINSSGTTTPIAANGGSTTFTVTFTPTAVGVATGSIVILSDDPDSEATYTFSIQAEGLGGPDINVQGNSVDIVDGDTTPSAADHTDFEQVTTGSNLVRTFTIQNTGNASLNLSSISLGLGSNSQFSINTGSVTTPVPVGGSTTFTVTFNATSTGIATGSIVIISDDPDTESTYTFNIQAEGVALTEPDINVQGNSVDIADGDTTPSVADHTDFEQVAVGSNLVRTFTIQNTGNTDLNLSSVGFGLGTNSQFTINTGSVTTPVSGGGGSTTFTVTFTPTTTGIATGSIVIISDDPDTESTYTFSIQAEGIAANDPEMDVLGNGTEITSGDTTPSTVDNTDFGQADVASGTISQTFTIENNGTDDLLLTDPTPFVTITGTNASDFTVSARPASTISSGNSTTFTIVFDPSAVGIRTATVSIANNDSDENPYTFAIQGEGIDNNAGTPLLITQYYENGGNDVIEIKNVSSSTVPQQFFLCVYEDLSTTTNVITTSAPDQNVQIPTLAAGQVITINSLSFTGNDVILISTSNGNDSYGARIDIMGVVGNTTPPVWGANTSYIKGCGTNESPSLTFAYDVASNTVTDYIELTIAEVDAASSNTNLFLGTQTVGPTTYTSSWSNGVPDKTKNAIVNGTYTAGTGSFESCDLTIGVAGSIDFGGSTSDFIKVNNDLAINGNFILGDNAALITVSESANITGAITKQESSTTLNNSFDFTYWSSPVQGATTSVFTSTGAPADRIFEWRKPSSGDYGGWDLKSGSLEQARGYISEAPTGSTQHNISFTGTPYNGIVSIEVGFDSSTPGGGGGFNLVGNPYPCAIDADAFILLTDNEDINNTPFDGTLWFWTHNTAYQENEGELNDYNVDDYVTYNLVGGSSPGVTNNIGSSQGFFVNTVARGPIFFTNEMKLDGQNTQFFRGDTKKSSEPKDRLWLNVTSKEGGAFDEILIGFMQKATEGVDRGYDGVKFSGGNYVSLYSNIEDKKYAIQGLSTFSSDKSVSIGFDAWVKETFTIALNTVEGVLNNEEIYLVDNYLNVVHDLKTSGYEFEITETGSFADRFTLQFNKSVLGVDDELINNNFIVANENNTLRVRASETVANIKVYDMLGRLLIDNNPDKSDFTLNTENIAKGTVLVLNATLENGVEVSKKTIKF